LREREKHFSEEEKKGIKFKGSHVRIKSCQNVGNKKAVTQQLRGDDPEKNHGKKRPKNPRKTKSNRRRGRKKKKGNAVHRGNRTSTGEKRFGPAVEGKKKKGIKEAPLYEAEKEREASLQEWGDV